MNSLDMAQLQRLKQELLSKLPYIAPKSALASIDVCHAMRTTAGLANYSRNLIKLNYRLLQANPHHIVQTFTHELAHLVAVELHGLKAKGHGHYWQQVMLAFGAEPRRCHKLDVSGLRRKHKTHQLYCKCKIHTVKSGRYNKLVRGVNYRCVLCKTLLKLNGE